MQGSAWSKIEVKQNLRVLQDREADKEGTKLNEQALSHAGRFKVISDKLHIKEVYAGEGTARQRYVIAYNKYLA